MAVCTLFTSLIFVIAACGPRITNDNLEIVEKERTSREQLAKGISPKEVESILGQPTRSESTKLALETQKKEVEVVRFYYEQDGEQLELHFVDGKLISPVPKLGAPKLLPPQK
jgi:hypothetical protein